jgi:hypothetical protein
MAKCICYDEDNFSGNTLELDGDERDLTNVGRAPFGTRDWNDVIKSIQINSGTWQFFEHVNFQGRVWELGPGSYRNEFPQNIISSIHCM